MTNFTRSRNSDFSRDRVSRDGGRDRRESGARQGGFRDSGSRDSGSRDGARGGDRGFNRGGASRGGSRFGSRGGNRGGARQGGNSPRPFDPKRSFKKDHIDASLFIRKAVLKDIVPYVAKNKFEDFNLPEKMLENMTHMNFNSPSPIQDEAIPVLINGSDVIGIAATGTGKTGAFLVPLIKGLVERKIRTGMVLCPTRELAEQVEGQFRRLTRDMKLYSFPIVGGSPIGKQMIELKKGLDMIVGTPGRVKDLMEKGRINMAEVDYIVLDEADRMLDMGFVDDMRLILGKMPEEKQGLFFSATFSPEIKSLCGAFLRNPVNITIPSVSAGERVDQDVIKYRGHDDRFEKLCEILKTPDAGKVIIFRETKRDTDHLADELINAGFSARAIHGDMRNTERKRALKDLTTGMAQIVIATDVAARGIDINDITHVINYDIPNNYETYVHRIGRTGRNNKAGIAFTFLKSR